MCYCLYTCDTRSMGGRRRYGSTERLPRVSRSNLRSVSEANLLSSDHYTDHQDIRKIRRDFEQQGKE